ncbi:MAG: oligosaccharide flippase family protein [Pyrobaculum sp.]
MARGAEAVESPALGVGLGYLATVLNYALALAYVVALTKFIPLEDYGIYNSLVALLSLFWLFLPNFGVYTAIMREGAAVRGRGGDVGAYFAALLFLQLAFSVAYAAIVVGASPLYLVHYPPRFHLMVVLVALYTILNGLNNALSAYLWMVGRFQTQALGSVVQYLIFRSLEVALIVAFRTVYAIPISLLAGTLANAAVYLRAAGRLPNPLRGVALLKSGFRRFLGLGVQDWLIDYAGLMASNATAYLVFLFLGPSASGLYGIATQMLGVVSSFVVSTYSVYLARASRSLGAGGSVLATSLDYARATQSVSALLAVSAAAVSPLLPWLHIVHGNYTAAIPYAMAFFGSAAVGAPAAIFRGHFWVLRRGWRSVVAITTGNLAGLAAIVALSRAIGLFSTVVALYVSAVVPLVFFLRWEPSLRGGVSLAFAALAAAGSLLFAFWPFAQAAALASVLVALYLLKPLPRPVLDQIPSFLKPLAEPFVRR